jgi:hypothetical protein
MGKNMSTANMVSRRVRGWISPLLLVLLALMLATSAHAAKRSWQLADGVVVTMDLQTNQTVITLEGQSHSSYLIESSEDLMQWVTLDGKAKIPQNGSYSYFDSRRLTKCFYRVTLVRV